ncbi:MAG: hypothetical protein ABIS14_13510 [Sphingomonas sp.]
MDLSFLRFDIDVDARVTVLPPDLAVMLVGIAARQAASPTARVQARLASAEDRPMFFAPRHGAFNPAMAQLLTGWKQE